MYEKMYIARNPSTTFFVSKPKISGNSFIVIALLAIAFLAYFQFVFIDAFADDNAAAIAYRSNTGTNTINSPKYREWNPSTQSWGAEVELASAGGPVRFAWLEFSPISSKRVIVAQTDSGLLDSYVCSASCTTPSSWTQTANFADLWTAAPTGADRPFDMAFESTSGDLIIVYDRVSTTSGEELFYRVMAAAGTSFGAETPINTPTPNTGTDKIYPFIRMDSRKTPGSDELAMVMQDDSYLDAHAMIWTGSSWGTSTTLTSAYAAASLREELIGIAYETSSGDVIAVAGQTTAMRYNQKTAGSGWGAAANFGTVAVGNVNWVTIKANPVSTSNEIFVAEAGDAYDLDSQYWSGSAWTDHAEHDAAIDIFNARTFDYTWDNTGSQGLLVWGTASGQLDFKRFTAPSTFTAGTFAETGTHPWVTLVSQPNPLIADTVSAIGATLDSTFDIGGIRWDGGSSNPVSTGDGGITVDTTVTTFEAISIDFQKAGRSFSRSVSDNIASIDSGSKNVAKKLADETISLSDSNPPIIVYFLKGIQETIVFLPSTNVSMRKDISDLVQFSVTIARHTGKSLSAISLSLTDENVVKSVAKSAIESLSLTDVVAKSASLSVADSLFILDSTIKSTAKSVSDSLSSVDSTTAALSLAKSLQETLFMADQSLRTINKVLADSIYAVDSAGKSLFKQLAEEVIQIQDNIESAEITITVALQESLQIASNIYDISMGFGRTFAESITLTMSFISPYLAIFGQPAADTITIQDQVMPTLYAVLDKNVGDSLAIRDSIVATLTFAPPPIPGTGAFAGVSQMPKVMVTNNASWVGPMQPVKLQGTYNTTNNVQTYVNITGIPVQIITPQTSNQTMVSQTYKLDLNTTGTPSGRAAYVTPIIQSLPAGTQLIISVDAAACLGATGQNTTSISFTPAVSSTNVNFAVTKMDSKPASAPQLAQPTAACFMDISWSGAFGGGTTPASPAYYKVLPKFTFTVTEAWAQQENVVRNGAGLPAIQLWVLNESTNQWESVIDIQYPASATGGVYTYVATLPHMSVYAVSADKQSGGGSGGSAGSSATLQALLEESISLGTGMQTIGRVVEEGRSSISIGLNELLTLNARPTASGAALKVGDLSISFDVGDVSPGGMLSGATLSITFNMENNGDTAEQLSLRYWYSAKTGAVLYSGSQLLEIEGGDATSRTVQVPFASEGEYTLFVEATSSGGIVNTSSLNVTVPWLAVNLQSVIAAAVTLIAVAIGVAVYMLKFRGVQKQPSIVKSKRLQRFFDRLWW